MKIIEGICPACDRKYLKKYVNQIFCLECAKKKPKLVNGVVVKSICLTCKKEFIVTNAANTKGKFCCMDCYVKYRSPQKAERIEKGEGKPFLDPYKDHFVGPEGLTKEFIEGVTRQADFGLGF